MTKASDETLRRVRELIALAGSNQLEEARTAAYLACEMMRKHAVHVSFVEPDAPPVPLWEREWGYGGRWWEAEPAPPPRRPREEVRKPKDAWYGGNCPGGTACGICHRPIEGGEVVWLNRARNYMVCIQCNPTRI